MNDAKTDILSFVYKAFFVCFYIKNQPCVAFQSEKVAYWN